MSAATSPEPLASATAEPRYAGNCDSCVIIPMYNESTVIAEVVTRVRRVFPKVVCIDDGSSDDCAVQARRAGAHVVRHPVNLGQGAALQTGFEFGLLRFPDTQYFVTFDADGQHRVQDAEAMLRRAREGDVDVVLGSRFLESGGDVPALRRQVLRLAVLFTKATTGLALTDAHNGLRVFSRKAAQIVDIRLHGMAHASEILTHVARSELSYCEIPVQVLYTDYSRSKGQSTVNAVNILFELFVQRFR